jgi:KaiC/GvpD/RAD55 family RecA-like ATPase
LGSGSHGCDRPTNLLGANAGHVLRKLLLMTNRTPPRSHTARGEAKTTNRFHPGIDILQTLLPGGFPRNDLILLLGEAGTAKSFVMLELLHKVLSVCNEPCIFVNVDDPYLSVEQDAASLGWDIRKFESSGQLKFLDCFSFRMDVKQVPSHVRLVPDPKDLRSLTVSLFNLIDELQMRGRGAVFVDSITEMFTLVSETGQLLYQVLDAVKSWRAKGPKEKHVAFFCSHHLGIEQYTELEALLLYAVDGIIDLRFDPVLFEKKQILSHEIRIREMKGARHQTRWVPFAITDDGIKQLQSDPSKKD